MFNTLKTYHFHELPQSLKDKAEKMIDDISPLGTLYEGTIDAVEVWGRDDVLLLMRAMYNEGRENLGKYISDKLRELGADLINHKPYSFNRGMNVGMTKAYEDILTIINAIKEE